MSTRTPVTLMNGTGKPRLILCTAPFYKSTGSCTYSENTILIDGAPALQPPVEAGQRLAAYIETAPAAPKLTFGKILEVDEGSGAIGIDGWTNGIPACLPGAPSAAYDGLGNIGIGPHRYAITFVVDGHETPIGLASEPLVIAGQPGKALVNNIPLRDEGLNGICTARKLYRTTSGGSVFRLLVALQDNTTTEFSDNIADVSLGPPAGPGIVPGFVIDGWIADLPRCQEMTETFEPYTLVHHLYRGNKQSKFFGWQYRAQLDYGKYFSADAFHDLRRQLNAAPGGSLILIPRRDAPQFQYNVYYDEPLNLTRYGKSAGYRKTMLHFAGAELVASFPAAEGYGTGYSEVFGEQL